MKLLILTQAVDLDDPVLGFFHRWIEKISTRFESVHVICLKKGRYDLPSNVTVYSLGKERGHSPLQYIVRFFSLVWSLLSKYDAVFVHMNEEYVLLGGWLWRLFGKRIVLWRNHKMGSWQTRLACALAHVICYTSPEAFVASYAKARVMPIGIDTDVFKPLDTDRPEDRVLFLGRLDIVKKPELFLEAMAMIPEAKADVYGDPTPGREEYAIALKERFADLQNVTFHPSVRTSETPGLFRSYSVYVNTTPSGSFDKTIGEAMASGALVVAVNKVIAGIVPQAFVVEETPASVAATIRAALSTSELERRAIREKERSYIEREHSLALLVERLFGILTAS